MGKSIKKSKQSAYRKNESLNQVILQDEEAIFGRALKTLGNGRFRIQVPDHDGRGTEADAVIPSKSTVHISIGDVVIVGRDVSGKKIIYQILGSCNKKSVEVLRKAKRLHPSLFQEEDELGDDIFDRSEDAKSAEEVTENPKEKKDKHLRDRAEDDEVDINNI